jgi:hypothetical protein
MNSYLYMKMHMHTCIYRCVNMHTYMHTHMDMYVCRNVCMYLYMCIYTTWYKFLSFFSACQHIVFLSLVQWNKEYLTRHAWASIFLSELLEFPFLVKFCPTSLQFCQRTLLLYVTEVYTVYISINTNWIYYLIWVYLNEWWVTNDREHIHFPCHHFPEPEFFWWPMYVYLN